MAHPFLETYSTFRKPENALGPTKRCGGWHFSWRKLYQGKDQENIGRWESGMVNFFLINAEANNFILKGFAFHCVLW